MCGGSAARSILSTGVTRLGRWRHRGGVSAIGLEEADEKWADELMGYATAIAGRTDAADIVSDAFWRLLQNGSRDSASRNGAVDPRAYLFRCASCASTR